MLVWLDHSTCLFPGPGGSVLSVSPCYTQQVIHENIRIMLYFSHAKHTLISITCWSLVSGDILSTIWYKWHPTRQLNCWSLRRSWSTTCRHCSNYIFILDLTPGFNGLGKDNCMTRQETFKLWDLVFLILEVWWYIDALVNWVIFVSGNGLSPNRRQAITWNNDDYSICLFETLH